MASAYLKKLQEQYEELRSGIGAVQTRALEANEDLTEDELRSVQENIEKGKALFSQIETQTDHESRSAKVTALAASLPREPEEAKVTEGAPEVRTANTVAVDRDPGHYRSLKDGGQYSFFADQVRARLNGDADARTRLDEHTRAAVASSGNAGILPPKWLTEEYMSLARQTRVAAARVRHLPLGHDPRPLNLPKQITGATDIPTHTEGANSGFGGQTFTTGTDVLTPATFAEYYDVNRQLLDGSDPAVDMLVYADLRAAWDTKMESLVCAAILGGTAFRTIRADDFTGADQAGVVDNVIDAQVAVSDDLRGPADTAIMNFGTFGSFRKLKDSTGRPLMPVSRYNPQNANGALGNVLMGDIEGVDALGTSGVPTPAANANAQFAILRANAVIFAESEVLDFTYDQVVGPSQVRIGIWGYAGTLLRNPGSVQVITVTPAES